MTRDDIIRMAMRAGLYDKVDCSDHYFIPARADEEEIVEFAALVAAAEREKCAHVCLDQANAPPGEGREMALFCAAAIRARGRE